jgi:hypothetical protein
MRIGELIWPEDRVAHIAEHGVRPHEVEEICFGRPLILRGKSAVERTNMSKIPKIDSIEELARFWDTHDITDFEEDLEEVEEPLFERGTEAVMRIRLPAEQAEALRCLAKARGVDEADLVEEWVREKLRAS